MSALTDEERRLIQNGSEADLVATLESEQGKLNEKSREIVRLVGARLEAIEQAKPNPAFKLLTDTATALNQAITFGQGDEITGLLGALGTLGSEQPFAERYRAYRDASRSDLREMNPFLRTGAELAGGMLTGGGAAQAGARFLGRANPQVPAVAREFVDQVAPTLLAPVTRKQAAVTAGGAGALAGAGASEAPIGSERFGQDVAMGTLLGAPLGALTFMSPTERQAIATKARSLLTPSSPEMKAQDLLRQRINEDVMPVENQARRLEGMRGGTIMDVSDSVRDAAMSIVTEGGKAGQRLSNFVEGRLGTSLRRVNQTLSNIIGDPKAYYRNQRQFEEQMKKDAAPLYEEFRKSNISMTEDLQDIVERIKLLRGGLIKEARANAYAAGDAPVQRPRPNRDADADEAEDIPMLDANMLDYIKQEMDDLIAGFIKRDKNNKARAYANLRNDLIAELDDQTNGSYALARQAYATPASNKAALEAGRKFMRLDAEEVEFSLQDFETPMEREMVRLGAARAISGKIGKRTTTQSVAKDLRQPVFKERLRQLFPNQPKAYDQLVKNFDDEDAMFETFSDLMTNSFTAKRTASGERLGTQIAEATGEAVVTGDPGVIRRAIQIVGRLGGRGAAERMRRLSDEVKDEFANIIINGNPQQRAEILRNLQNPNFVQMQPNAVPGLLGNQGAVPVGVGTAAGLLSTRE